MVQRRADEAAKQRAAAGLNGSGFSPSGLSGATFAANRLHDRPVDHSPARYNLKSGSATNANTGAVTVRDMEAQLEVAIEAESGVDLRVSSRDSLELVIVPKNSIAGTSTGVVVQMCNKAGEGRIDSLDVSGVVFDVSMQDDDDATNGASDVGEFSASSISEGQIDELPMATEEVAGPESRLVTICEEEEAVEQGVISIASVDSHECAMEDLTAFSIKPLWSESPDIEHHDAPPHQPEEHKTPTPQQEQAGWLHPDTLDQSTESHSVYSVDSRMTLDESIGSGSGRGPGGFHPGFAPTAGQWPWALDGSSTEMFAHTNQQAMMMAPISALEIFGTTDAPCIAALGEPLSQQELADINLGVETEGSLPSSGDRSALRSEGEAFYDASEDGELYAQSSDFRQHRALEKPTKTSQFHHSADFVTSGGPETLQLEALSSCASVLQAATMSVGLETQSQDAARRSAPRRSSIIESGGDKERGMQKQKQEVLQLSVADLRQPHQFARKNHRSIV